MDKYLEDALWSALANAVKDRQVESAKKILGQISQSVPQVSQQSPQIPPLCSSSHKKEGQVILGNRAIEKQSLEEIRETLEKEKMFESFLEYYRPISDIFRIQDFRQWIYREGKDSILSAIDPGWSGMLSEMMKSYSRSSNKLYKHIESLPSRGKYKILRTSNSTLFS